MTTARKQKSLAILVNSAPYDRRVARSDIDFALAAAALDFDLQVFFSGNSLLQLVAQRDPAPALLPRGYRAWAALPDLADVQIFAEQDWLDYCEAQGMKLVMSVTGLKPSEMSQAWRNCRLAMVL